jgi:hypothetical protein
VNVDIPASQLAKMQATLSAFLSHDNVADISVQIPPTQLAKMSAALKAWTEGLKNTVTVPVKLRPSDLLTMQAELAAFSREAAAADAIKLPVKIDLAGAIASGQIARATSAMDNYTSSIIQEMDAEKLAVNAQKAMALQLDDIRTSLPQVADAASTAEVKIRGIAGAFVAAGTDIAAANLAQSMFVQGSTRFGGWWQAATTGVRLFGGALDGLLPKFLTQVSGWHLATDAVLELAAAWIPATVAVGIFAAAAIPAAKTIYTQWQNLNTVINSVGTSKGMTDLGVGFDKLAAAVQPSVYVAFGEAMMAMKNDSAPLGAALAGVGKVIDTWGAGLVQWASHGLNSIVNLVKSGTPDLAKLGDAFVQVGRIIGTVLKDLPGYVKYLLDLGDAFLTGAADLVDFLSPVIKLGLALHGAILYIGLATTAVIALGRAVSLTAIASFWTTFGGDAEKAAAATKDAAELSTGKINGIGTALGSMAGKAAGWGAKMVGWGKDLYGAVKVLGPGAVASTAFDTAMAGVGGTVAIAAAALVPFVGIVGVALWDAWHNNIDVMAQWRASMLSIINNSNPTNLFNNTTKAIEQTSNALRTTISLFNKIPKSLGPYAPAAGGAVGPYAPVAGGGKTGPYNSGSQPGAPSGPYSAQPGLSAQAAQQALFLNTQLVNSAIQVAKNEQAVSNAVGGVGNAMSIANKLGISWNQINTANASQLKTIITEMTAYAGTMNYLSQSAGHAASNVAALTFAGSEQLADVQKINQAWGTYLQTLQGGEAAFVPLEQGIQQYNKDLKTTGASMTGLNPASLQLRQDFLTVSSAAENQISALTTYAAVTGGATKANKALANEGIKDVIAQLVPLAKGNDTAKASIIAMAQRADGSIHTWQQVTQWLGKKGATGAAQQLDQINGRLALSMKNVAAVAGSLAGTLNGLVSSMQDSLLLGINHVAQKMATFAKDLALSKGVMSQTAQVAGVTLYKALVKSGMGADAAKAYVLALAKSQGATSAGLQKLTNDLNAQQTAMNKSSQAARNLAKDTSALSTTFTKLATGGLHMTSAAITALWSNIKQQDLDAVAGKANNTKAAFINFAVNGLGKTQAEAQALWDKFKAQNLDATANKATTTKAQFVNLAMNGLHLTSAQASALWSELRLQYLDTLAQKGDSAKASFISLAKQGLDLTTSQAQALWNTLKQQYLDTLATKAGETKTQFENVAKQFGLTKGQADALWGSLKSLAGGSPYGVKVNETLTGSGAIKALVSAAGVSISSAGASPGSAQTASSQVLHALGSTGKAAGGIITGGIHGQDSVHAVLAPGELVIPSSHAAAHMTQAKREGIPGMAAGGVAGGLSNQAAVASTAQQGVPTMENAAVQFTAEAMGQFAGQLNSAYQAQQAAVAGVSGPLGPAGAGEMANGAAIYKYLMQYAHMTKIAAAGAIASIWGESTWNPMAINCVPLDYQIVTTRGILYHDELRVGDKTPTWNPATGRMELATVLDIPYHYEANVCRIGNDHWSVICTWDHKWITDAGLVRADQLHIPDKILVGDGHYEPIEFREDMGTEDTWCVTTTTGTWTTYRDGEAIFTGNSNGRGLIGWTPQGTISDANYRGGLATQLPQIIRFIDTSGDWGVISEMNNATSVLQAANLWGKGVERYGINDVHSEGLALATSIMNSSGSAAPAQGLANTIARVSAKPHSAGGMVSEPVYGFGKNSGMPYSFAENGQSEYVGPLSGGAQGGAPPMTSFQGQTLIQLLQMLVQQGNALPQNISKAQQTGLGVGMLRGARTTGG